MAGQVVDSNTGLPLKKAWVTARQAERGGRSGSTAVTDSEGRFLLQNLDAGRYVLSVQRNGYVSQAYGQRNAGESGTTISLVEGQKLTDISFRLLQGGVITGRVFDEDSEPLARAQVQALQFRYMQGSRRLMPVGNGVSDDRGEYRIFGIRPGQVYVRAMLRGSGFIGPGETVDSSAPSETTSYPPVFYPNVLDATQASPLTVRGGDELHVDFSMRPQRSYTVSGRVVGGLPGMSGRGFLMLIKRGEGEFAFGPGMNTGVRDDGTFTFKQVLPGSYNLIAQQQEEKTSASARVEVDVREGDVQGIVVSLAPKVEVNGRVRFDVTPGPKTTGINVALTPEDVQDFMRGAYAQVKEDGTFSLQAAPDERYRISSYGLPPGMYLKTATAGRDDVLEKGFSVATSRNLDLVFAAGAKVSGTVNAANGKGEPGVTIVLTPDQKLTGLTDAARTATTDQNGRYQVQGLRPGSYHVYAFEHIEQGAYEDEEWMKGFADQAQTVRLAEGGQETLNLKAIPAGAEVQ
ncbi:MAG TPA: carboxypeptidase-like regulatory domain-containing protein [Terriglobales bacterium]|nr:carboxypeptidase-like regulatory domain-containing protein [Terriglobales bacterium]